MLATRPIRRLAALLLVAATASLTACGGTSGSAGTSPTSSTASASPSQAGSGETPAGSIVVYNAQHEELTQAWVDAFTAATGVKVEMRNGEDPELANLLVEEGAASPADVFLTENSPSIALVEKAGLFAPVDQATLDQVPEAYRPSTGMWAGIAARSTVFAYDTRALTEAQLPKSLMDLQSDTWKGRWGASPGGADFQAIVAALLQLKGEAATTEWLAAMKANVKPYQGNSTVMKAVNAGEIAGGIIYHYYWFGDRAETGENSQNVALYYFKGQDPGAFVGVSGGGVLASSENPTAAQAFITFITGVEGQTILQAGGFFDYPIASDVSPAPGLVPLDQLDPPVIDPSALDAEKTTELMTAAGLL